MSGADYLKLSDGYQRAFTLGLFEGFVLSGLTDDDLQARLAIKDCLKDLKTDAAIAFAFASWLRANPQLIIQPARVSFTQWTIAVCPAVRAQ